MAEWRLESCAWCRSETWCEKRKDGRSQCRACKVEKFFENALYRPLGFTLIRWQRDVLRGIFGPCRPEDGSRLVRQSYVSVAKQNGKSFLVGGLPIYHLLMEDEIMPEAYGAAAAKEQAGIVFRSAATLVRANPALRDRLRIIESTKHIVRKDGFGFYAALSADGDVQDGVRPSLLIKDELHRWKTAKAHTLSTILTKGQKSRRQPLEIAITTAGAQYESDLWWDEYEYARQILRGSINSDRYFAAIWAADEKRIKDDPEYWKSREARVAANPSHEDLGGFLKDEAITAELDKAVINPAKRADYIRYDLNVPLTTDTDPVIDMYAWQECAGGVDLRNWPEYDVELLVRKWGLIEKPCFAGVDASWTTDMTAVVFLFPPFGAVDIWTVLCFSYLPKERLHEIERRVRVNLSDWSNRGFLELTPGDAIAMPQIVRRLRWGREMFDLRAVAYDRCNFRSDAIALNEEGWPMREVAQGYLSLSPATKALLGFSMTRQIRHGNNPVLNWHAACLRLMSDNKDNVQPRKPERAKSSARIDLISATVTALKEALEQEIVAPANVRSMA